jgi:hypothetical protein
LISRPAFPATKSKMRKGEFIYCFNSQSGRTMKTAGSFGGPTRPALIPGQSFMERWLRSREPYLWFIVGSDHTAANASSSSGRTKRSEHERIRQPAEITQLKDQSNPSIFRGYAQQRVFRFFSRRSRTGPEIQLLLGWLATSQTKAQANSQQPPTA